MIRTYSDVTSVTPVEEKRLLRYSEIIEPGTMVRWWLDFFKKTCGMAIAQSERGITVIWACPPSKDVEILTPSAFANLNGYDSHSAGVPKRSFRKADFGDTIDNEYDFKMKIMKKRTITSPFNIFIDDGARALYTSTT